MRTTEICMALAVGLLSAPSSLLANCQHPLSTSVELTEAVMSQIGFSPSGEIFQFIDPRAISVSTSEVFTTELPINEDGDTISADVVSVEVSVLAELRSLRAFFLQRVSQELPRPGRNDSTGVDGGFMSIIDPSLVRVSGTVWYEDNSSDVSWWHQGTSRTPIWLDLSLFATDDERDLRVEPTFHSGSTSVSSPFTGIVDLFFAPITLGLEILGEPTIGEALIENPIEESVDAEIANRRSEIQDYLDSTFATDLINNLAEDEAALFLSVFRERLYISSEAGFRGANPEPVIARLPFGASIELPAARDAGIEVNIAKGSRDEEWRSLFSPEQACAFYESIAALDRISREVEGSHSTEYVAIDEYSLDEISTSEYGGDRFAMTIAQFNGMTTYGSIMPGDTLVLPNLSEIISSRYHFVRENDTIWSILEQYDIDPTRYLEVTENQDFSQNGNLIFPGMLVDLAPFQ